MDKKGKVKPVEEKYKEDFSHLIAPEGYEYFRSHAMDSDICIRKIKTMSNNQNNPQEVPQVKSVEQPESINQILDHYHKGEDYNLRDIRMSMMKYGLQQRAPLNDRIAELEYKLTSANVQNDKYKEALEGIRKFSKGKLTVFATDIKQMTEHALNGKEVGNG